MQASLHIFWTLSPAPCNGRSWDIHDTRLQIASFCLSWRDLSSLRDISSWRYLSSWRDISSWRDLSSPSLPSPPTPSSRFPAVSTPTLTATQGGGCSRVPMETAGRGICHHQAHGLQRHDGGRSSPDVGVPRPSRLRQAGQQERVFPLLRGGRHVRRYPRCAAGCLLR